MSRAFVKESDRDDTPVVRTERRHPYYITPGGLVSLQSQLARAAGPAADELRARIADAVVVDPAAQSGSAVDFGARVTIELPGGTRAVYQIVGEDEAAPLEGTISWTSPLAQALWGKRTGSKALWERPAGNVKIRIANVEYV